MILKKYILIFGLAFSTLIGKSQADYKANYNADYLFAPDNARWGANIGANFNLSKQDFKYPTFLGFNIGVGQNTEKVTFTQESIDAFAVGAMSGENLSNATVISASNPIGVVGGLNLIQYFFTHTAEVPYIGLGTRASYFSRNAREVSIQSTTGTTDFIDNEFMTINKSFIGFSAEIHAMLGQTHNELYLGMYPGAGSRPSMFYVGLSYILAGSIRY